MNRKQYQEMLDASKPSASKSGESRPTKGLTIRVPIDPDTNQRITGEAYRKWLSQQANT